MIFRVGHDTSYRFSRPVFLEPHIIRLRPRCDAFQELHDFELTVTPSAAGRSDGYDSEGNLVCVLWFEDLTDSLDIRTESTVETLRPNPFDFILTSTESQLLPVTYDPYDETVLEPYRKDAGSKTVRELAADLTRACGGNTQHFLNLLTRRLYDDWTVVIREEGDPYPAEETMRTREVSCRDLTGLFLSVCRTAGIAGRFTSGYQEGDQDQEKRFMHAWPEVYLPGMGWRGYDPTHGLVVSDRHIALASGADFRGAAPTVGTFRGTQATSQMEVRISIETPENI